MCPNGPAKGTTHAKNFAAPLCHCSFVCCGCLFFCVSSRRDLFCFRLLALPSAVRRCLRYRPRAKSISFKHLKINHLQNCPQNISAKSHVKSENGLTHYPSIRYPLQRSFIQPVIIETESKKVPARSGPFDIKPHKPFRKNNLPVTPLE